MGKEIKWNVVSEVGYPKEAGIYYVTYKDFSKTKAFGETRVTVTEFVENAGADDRPYISTSYEILDDDDIIAWAKADFILPDLYIPPKKEKKEVEKEENEEGKEETLGDVIRRSSNEDLCHLIGMIITDRDVSMHQKLCENIAEAMMEDIKYAAYTAIYMGELEKTLDKPYKGTSYQKTMDNTK